MLTSLPHPLKDIAKPGPHDILCGRGGGTNAHPGNVKFRRLVAKHKLRYLAASKSDKPDVARIVVWEWRSLDPPGRFLAKGSASAKESASVGGGASGDDGNDGGGGKCPSVWHDVGDKKAREKASQCLRERNGAANEAVNALVKCVTASGDTRPEDYAALAERVALVQAHAEAKQALYRRCESPGSGGGGGVAQVDSSPVLSLMPGHENAHGNLSTRRQRRYRGETPPTGVAMGAPQADDFNPIPLQHQQQQFQQGQMQPVRAISDSGGTFPQNGNNQMKEINAGIMRSMAEQLQQLHQKERHSLQEELEFPKGAQPSVFPHQQKQQTEVNGMNVNMNMPPPSFMNGGNAKDPFANAQRGSDYLRGMHAAREQVTGSTAGVSKKLVQSIDEDATASFNSGRGSNGSVDLHWRQQHHHHNDMGQSQTTPLSGSANSAAARDYLSRLRMLREQGVQSRGDRVESSHSPDAQMGHASQNQQLHGGVVGGEMASFSGQGGEGGGPGGIIIDNLPARKAISTGSKSEGTNAQELNFEDYRAYLNKFISYDEECEVPPNPVMKKSADAAQMAANNNGNVVRRPVHVERKEGSHGGVIDSSKVNNSGKDGMGGLEVEFSNSGDRSSFRSTNTLDIHCMRSTFKSVDSIDMTDGSLLRSADDLDRVRPSFKSLDRSTNTLDIHCMRSTFKSVDTIDMTDGSLLRSADDLDRARPSFKSLDSMDLGSIAFSLKELVKEDSVSDHNSQPRYDRKLSSSNFRRGSDSSNSTDLVYERGTTVGVNTFDHGQGGGGGPKKIKKMIDPRLANMAVGGIGWRDSVGRGSMLSLMTTDFDGVEDEVNDSRLSFGGMSYMSELTDLDCKR